MTVRIQNVTMTTRQFKRAWTIHAFIVVIETSAFRLAY